ncbi:hypothetical protein H0H92_010506 [Tricholoma furcatifolium]|nr:hypothetical protein H0H92_010506 [Tricholoma furcatifolium]
MITAPPSVSETLALHIASIPKIDKSYHISRYLREQSAHAEMYAAEGRAMELSWTREKEAEMFETESGKAMESPHPNLVVDCGFETPVLKPRAVRHPQDSQKHSIKKQKAYSPLSKDVTPAKRVVNTEQRRVKRKRSSCEVITAKVPRDQRTRRTRERKKDRPSSDKEYYDRLNERRERKRAKRAVMEALSSHGSSSQDKASVQIDTKKTLAKESAKPKGLENFALMHGFTATNVGARRLTVKPTLSAGVFSRGRASLKCRPVERDTKGSKAKKVVNSYRIFTENEFLNKVSKIPKPQQTNLKKKKKKKNQARSQPSSSFHNSSHRDTSSSHIMNNSLDKAREVADEVVTPDGSKNSCSITPHDICEHPHTNNKPQAESVVWDIELDGFNLPSQTPFSNKAPSVSNNGLKLSPPNLSGDETNVVASYADLQQPVKVIPQPEVADESSSTSIGPSDSASQCAIFPRGLPHVSEATSRYFVSKLPKPLPPPMGIPDKPEGGGRIVAHSDYNLNLELKGRNSVPTLPSVRDALGNNATQGFCISANYAPSAVESYPLVGLQQVYAISAAEFSPLVDLQQPYDISAAKSSPLVDLQQDYECSDREFYSWPSDNLNCNAENLSIPRETIYDSDGLLFSNNLSFYQRYELEASSGSGFEDQYYAGDGSENRNEVACDSMSSFEGDETWDILVNDDAEGSRIGEIFPSRNSKDLELGALEGDICIDNEAGLVDLTSRFTEGKALLLGLGYTEEDSHTPLSPMTCRYRQLPFTPAEIHVAKTLRNHWLPQRL